MSFFKKKVLLPTTPDLFDKLVDRVVAKYNLPERDHAAAVIANRMMHLPPDQAYCTEQYLAHCVLKNVAYQVAQSKGSQIQHKMQIDALAAALTADPLNQEVIDALEKAANQGSEYAKKVLASQSIYPEPVPILKDAKGLNIVYTDHMGEDAAPHQAASPEPA